MRDGSNPGVGGGDADPVARSEDRELTLMDRVADGSDRTPAREYVHQRVEVAVPRVFRRAPGSIVACAMVIGVCVAPGP